MSAKYEFFAGRDFKEKNLIASKGERLPDRWQDRGLIRTLRERFGEDAVVTRQVNTDRSGERIITKNRKPAEEPKKR